MQPRCPRSAGLRAGLRPLSILLVLVLGAACNDEDPGPVPGPPDGYPYAYATNGCGPTDGPATRIILAADTVAELPAAVSRVEVSIYRSAGELQGRRFIWAGSSDQGQAARCDAGGSCEPATATSIEFRENAVDTLLSGTLSLRFGDGTTVSGGFDATWKRTDFLCG